MTEAYNGYSHRDEALRNLATDKLEQIKTVEALANASQKKCPVDTIKKYWLCRLYFLAHKKTGWHDWLRSGLSSGYTPTPLFCDTIMPNNYAEKKHAIL
jgi:hypothetical protein